MERVNKRINDNRLTDVVEPEPLNPLRISEIAGDQPNKRFNIWGPEAPICDRTRAPPIQRKNGPSRRRIALIMKLVNIPLLPIGPYPPLD